MGDSFKQAVRFAALPLPRPLVSPVLSFHLNAEIEQLRKQAVWQDGRTSKTMAVAA